MLEPIASALAVAALVAVFLWFAVGTQLNVRRGNAILRWLQGGLPLIGRRTTMRWLGSSAVELGIAEPVPPFREATVVVVLEPRDVSFLWAYARWRGRRDFMIVRMNLVAAPRFAIEVRDPRGWTGRHGGHETDATDGGPWRALDWPGGALARGGPGADELAVRKAWTRLAGVSDGPWLLTVQQVVPHLEVHVRPASTAHGADELMAPIRELAVKLAER